MATAQELELLQLLNDPWRSMAARGVYGKYGSLAEEMADDYAIAEETAKKSLAAGGRPADVYARTFGPVERRWVGAPTPVKAEVVRGSDGALYEYNPETGATRELVAPKVPQQFQTVTKESYDDQGNRITTEQKVPIGAASVAGTATGTPTSFKVAGYDVKVKGAPAAAPSKATPVGHIGAMTPQGMPTGPNRFSATPFDLESSVWRPAPKPPVVVPTPAATEVSEIIPTFEVPTTAPVSAAVPNIESMETSTGGLPITSGWFWSRMAPRGSLAYESGKDKRISDLTALLQSGRLNDMQRKRYSDELAELTQNVVAEKPNRSMSPFFMGPASPFRFARP